MLSASKNPLLVEECLAKELACGRVVQVDPRRMEIHINCFGVIPKGHDNSQMATHSGYVSPRDIV